MKKLVVFYSLEGHTKELANAIAKVAGADILEVKMKKEVPKKGFMRYVKGGGQVVRKIEPEIYPLELDPQEYDVLFIGTPVWAGSYASPLRSFFSIVDLQGKRVALFAGHRGGKGKVFQHFRESLAGNEVLGEKEFIEKNGMEQNIKEAESWAQGIMNSL